MNSFYIFIVPHHYFCGRLFWRQDLSGDLSLIC